MQQDIDVAAAKERIEQYCQRVKSNLNKFALGDKKKALKALDVQVVTSPEKVKIRIAVHLDHVTTGQTSA